MATVFASYARADEEIARGFAQFLHGASFGRLEVALDQKSLAVASGWRVGIEDLVRECDALLILMTPESATSTWVHFEGGIKAGLDKERIFVARIGDLSLADPFPLHELHGREIRNATNLEELARELFSVVGIDFDEDALSLYAERLIQAVNAHAGRDHSVYPRWRGDEIERAFSEAGPGEQIRILQTWIPRIGEHSYVRQWAEALGQACSAFEEGSDPVEIEVLLIGSRDLAELRSKHRQDMATDEGVASVAESVSDFEWMGKWSGHADKVTVKVRFYAGLMPFGPLFIFGNRRAFAGLYPFSATSDKAPMIRVSRSSKLWSGFHQQFFGISRLSSACRRPDWTLPRIVVAPDSFKDCRTADEVAEFICEGIARSGLSDVDVVKIPMADGGEGTLEAINADGEFEREVAVVHGPLGESVEASFLLSHSLGCAVIEAARACGLGLVAAVDRDPHRASTRGVGELVMAAVAKGVKRIILTIGGSATVDGGSGLARALGYRLLDAKGDDLPEGGLALRTLHRIVAPSRRPWDGIRVEVACDVDSPLLGVEGAAAVYAPQKAAPGTVPDIDGLEQGLAMLNKAMIVAGGADMSAAEFSGAAGGMGAGLRFFLGAELRRGFEVVREWTRLRERMMGADLIVTGEGSTDSQTLRGKVCVGVASLASEIGIPSMLVSGRVDDDADLRALFGRVHALSRSDSESLAVAIEQAPDRLVHAGVLVADYFSECRLNRCSTAADG